jgi:transposase-like protein
MPKKILSEEQKLQAVLDLLQGHESHAAICNRYGISQTYLYKLRDRAMQAIAESVKNKKDRPKTREEQLEAELAEAKQLVGDQAIFIQAFKKKLGLTGK